MHASINMHQLINPDNDNSSITIIAISVVIAVKCAYNSAAYIRHFYEACNISKNVQVAMVILRAPVTLAR